MQSASVADEGSEALHRREEPRAPMPTSPSKDLPKGKSLSAPTAANSVAMALTGLSLADVRAASAFQSTPPAAHATFKTFDGLVVDVDGWVQDQKHYVALRPSFDAALAERFKVATAPADESKDEKKDEKTQRDAPPSRRSRPRRTSKRTRRSSPRKSTGWVVRDPRLQVRGDLQAGRPARRQVASWSRRSGFSPTLYFFGSTTTRVPLQRSCHASRSRSIQIQK